MFKLCTFVVDTFSSSIYYTTTISAATNTLSEYQACKSTNVEVVNNGIQTEQITNVNTFVD